MRRFNAILAGVILALFVLHGVLGAFQLLGWGSATQRFLAQGMFALIVVHVVLSARLTAGSIRVWKKTGAPYFRENALFWARRISGLAVMALIAFHVTAFSHTVEGALRLRPFTGARLAAQLLLAASLAAHVISNVKPMLISFGVKKLRPRSGDILFLLSALLLIMTAAFIVYYLRWNAG